MPCFLSAGVVQQDQPSGGDGIFVSLGKEDIGGQRECVWREALWSGRFVEVNFRPWPGGAQ